MLISNNLWEKIVFKFSGKGCAPDRSLRDIRSWMSIFENNFRSLLVVRLEIESHPVMHGYRSCDKALYWAHKAHLVVEKLFSNVDIWGTDIYHFLITPLENDMMGWVNTLSEARQLSEKASSISLLSSPVP